jgi:hypothetical protein
MSEVVKITITDPNKPETGEIFEGSMGTPLQNQVVRNASEDAVIEVEGATLDDLNTILGQLGLDEE